MGGGMSKAKMKNQLGLCRLCNIEGKLIESHIIPKFIFKWQKKSSATGHIRLSINPNKRVQDGIKTPFLCKKCEGLFNEWETKFATMAFHPLVEGKRKKILYDNWLLKFSVSLSWRVLVYSLENLELSHLTENHTESIIMAKKIWEEFLLDKRPHPENHEQHLIYLGPISSYTSGPMPKNINRYFLRATSFDILTHGDQCLTYAKFPYFFIIGFIEVKKKQWIGSKIHLKHGIVGPAKYELPDLLWGYIKNEALKCQRHNDQLSEKQRKIINESYKTSMDRAVKSETIKAMTQDIILFGEKAMFNSKDEKDP